MYIIDFDIYCEFDLDLNYEYDFILSNSFMCDCSELELELDYESDATFYDIPMCDCGESEYSCTCFAYVEDLLLN